MSHFRLHTIKERTYLRYLILALAGLTAAAALGYAIHSIGTARARSRETVLIFTEEEFTRYLVDRTSEEYNLNGRYRLEEDLDLSSLDRSIGTNLEPFAGNLDGNGHVITGLKRPLFGVMEAAKVENLFLSGAEIRSPFTYGDGERYVDGYGTLAAYAVDSVIQNCGMNGEIYIASPAEAEFLMEKASPAEADEEKGPGAEESSVESSPVMNGGEGGSAAGGNGGAAGPGVESSHETGNAATEDTAEIGPGIESTGESEAGEPSESSAQENPGTTDPPAADESGNGNEISTSKAAEETESTGDGEEGGSVVQPSNPDNAMEGTEHSTEASSEGTEHSTDVSQGGIEHETDITIEETKTETVEETKEAAAQAPPEKEEVSAPEAQAGAEKDNAGADTRTGVQSNSADSHTGGTGGNDPLAETIGLRINDRLTLMMKAPEAVVSAVEEWMTASPSDATPSDADSAPEEKGPGVEPNGEIPDHESGGPGGPEEFDEAEITEESAYMQNSDGDLYILVTAQRITAGGLIAQTAGETLISDSFALAAIGSTQKHAETYTGGLAGILGTGTRTENSYAAGLADSAGITGGFAALNEGTIENSYSVVTLGSSGNQRGAFTALEHGRLIGCVYDRQMACANEGEMLQDPAENASPSDADDFGLTGMRTAELIGTDSPIPGTWRKTENAYPQLEYFALHEDQTVSASSKASVIALVLPEELTLADVVKNGDIVLPAEIDGEVVVWEAEGGIKVDEKNQIVVETSDVPSIESHNVPNVGSALESTAIATDSSALEPEQSVPDAVETTPSESEEASSSTSAQLKASVGNVSRNFTISALAATARATYANWGAVGEAVYNRTVTGTDFVPVLNSDGYYEIKTPEALACFAYMVNSVAGQTGINGKLMNDIDLNGTVNNWTTAGPLLWKSIGFSGSAPYTGTFDGGKHTIHNLKIDDMTNGLFLGLFAYINHATIKDIILSQVDVNAQSGAGLVGEATNGFVISGCGVESGIIKGSNNTAGILCSVASGGKGEISECYNKANVTISVNARAKVAGGILGRTNGTTSLVNIMRCYNWGEIWVPNQGDCHAAGIFPYGFSKSTIDSCYNIGKITGGSQHPVGGICANISINRGGIVPTNSYNLEGMGVLVANNGTQVSEAALKSWAAAFALNGQSLDGVWGYTPGEYPEFGVLEVPTDWSVVGKGGVDGLITAGKLTTGSGSAAAPYEITTEEQLAAYAYMTSTVNANLCAKMMNDIDLFGDKYTRFKGDHTIGNIESALRWIPIGGPGSFLGTFDGNGHVVDGMYVNERPSGRAAGFFESLGGHGSTTTVKGLGIGPNSKTVLSPGNSNAGMISGMLANNTSGGKTYIQNCFARGELQVKAGASGFHGAIVGDDAGQIYVYVTGCFAAVKGTVFSCISSGNAKFNYCFIDSTVTSPSRGAISVPTSDLKSWAAAYTLNGFQMNGAWKYDPTGNDYPTFGTLQAAPDWTAVGHAMTYKSGAETIIVGTGTKENPYTIATPEQLAVLAYKVSLGETDKHGVFTQDISLMGSEYGEFGASGPLPWRPIGDSAHVFKGSLNGKGKTISYMNVRYDGYAGLVGMAGEGAEIRGIGLAPTCRVEAITGSSGLDGTAAFVGAVKSDGTSKPQIMIKNCYNRASVTGKTGAATGAFVGTHVGEKGVGGQRITSCYTTGALSAADGGQPGAIAGTFRSNPKDQSSGIRYCYWDSNTSGSVAGAAADSGMVAIGDARAYSSSDMTTSQAVLDLLNTEVETGVWSRNVSTNDSYPIYGETTSPVYSSWEDVGKYHLSPPYRNASSPLSSGSADNPFQLSTPEDLAWFAYQVNHGDKDICGELLADINLFGGKYTGITYDETDIGMKAVGLPWVPAGIGTDESTLENVYEGEFQGNGHVISLMNASGTGPQGLFGFVYGAGQVGRKGTVAGTGIENSYISSATEAGGIAGRMAGTATVSRCFVRGGAYIETNETADACAGGIVGNARGMSRIEDCYIMEAEVVANGTGNIAGGIAGKKTAGPQVESCYSQMTTGGKIEGTKRGAIVGRQIGSGGEATIGNMNYCYSDVGIQGDSDTIKKLDIASSDALTQETVNELNMKNGIERTGTDRAWYTSLSTEPTKGYPTLVPPMTLTVTISPAQATTGSLGSLDGSLPEATYRGTRQEYGEGNPAFALTGNTVVSGAFSTWGSDSANEKLGLVTGEGTDLATLTGSLVNPTAAVGKMAALTLYNGAAYTCGKNRVIVIDVVSDGIRHEIRVTIQAAAEKTLNVVLPVKVGMEDLSPDGSLKKSYSADLTLTNQNDYPIAGSVLRLVPITGEGYVTLKPVAKNDPYGDRKQLSDPNGGVKLGIADTRVASNIVPAEGIYYTPAKDTVDPPVAEKWMEYRIRGKGILPYRYFIEYTANPHYNDTNQYGYTVNYQFGISKEDIPAGVDAVTK